MFALNWLLSLLVSIMRAGAGSAPATSQPHADALPTLYEFEACPFCRIAREAVSEAGLVVRVRPCPKRGVRFRPDVKRFGGKAQFPYLVSADTREGIYESRQIAQQVLSVAGRPEPLIHRLGPLNTISSQVAMLMRFMSGRAARASRKPEQALTYFGSERSPSGRLVKEHLCALEIEYVWVPISDGAPRLHDPNAGCDVIGARRILAYLSERFEP